MQTIRNKKALTDRSLTILVCVVYSLAALLVVGVPRSVYATILEDRSNQVSNSLPSGTGVNRISFTVTNVVSPIGSIRFEFCGNDPITDTPCTPPAGFDASAAALVNQEGEVDFAVHGDSTANELIITRTPAAPVAGAVAYEFDDIINPNYFGTYYLRVYTHGSEDGTGPSIQEGGLALSTSDEVMVAAEVPPYLRFCVAVAISGLDCLSATTFFISLGEFSTQTTTAATSQMLAATNAESGYSITMVGTTLTSGNNTIPASGTPTASVPGISRFGVNLRANSNPAVGAEPVGPGSGGPTNGYQLVNQFKFANNDIVVSRNVPDRNRKYTVSYVANISQNQSPGVYATTISFIALANF